MTVMRRKTKHPQVKRIIDFPVTAHQLRHTYITELCASGLDIKKIQYLAGHSDIQTTLNIYTHVTSNKPEDLGKLIDGIFSGSNSRSYDFVQFFYSSHSPPFKQGVPRSIRGWVARRKRRKINGFTAFFFTISYVILIFLVFHLPNIYDNI